MEIFTKHNKEGEKYPKAGTGFLLRMSLGIMFSDLLMMKKHLN